MTLVSSTSRRLSLAAGTALLLALAASTTRGQAARVDRGGFAEGTQEIHTLLLHYCPESAWQLLPVWRDLVAALPRSVEIVLAAPEGSEAAAEALLRSTGPRRRPAATLSLPGASTVWARDRLLVVRHQGRYALLSPDPECVQGDRQGDVAVAETWAGVIAGARWVSAPLAFEGGNVLFTERNALVGPQVFTENSDVDPDTLEELLGVPPLVVGARAGVLHEHLDMFLTSLGRGCMLLGDPRAGAELLDRLAADGLDSALPDNDEWNPDALRDLATIADGLAEELAFAGYRVVRIPWIRGLGGEVLTWNNALTEQTEHGRRAYVPAYGVPELDHIAQAAYAREGFAVFPIDVSRIAPAGGAVRCLTNVLRWSAVPAVEPVVPR